MIPRVHKQGSNTLGLLHYLYGKGTHEEHIDPHLVASFDGMAPDPGRDPSLTKTDLRHLLDQTLSLLNSDQRPDKHVWRCSVRAAPDDPILSDEQWGDIARRMVAATGIDPGDGAGCRWAAVRHADDHIHIIATLVREDGRRPDHHRSGKRAQTEARLIEADYDLHRVAPGDGTAAKRTTSAERHKADRLGWDRVAREELRETVRRAVAGAASTNEFLDRLKDSGLLVRTKVLPSGNLKGYTVALPGDRNGNKEPIYYAGSTLAPDLSLPRIQARLTTDSVPPGTADSERQERSTASSAPAAARRTTAHAAWAAVLVLDHSSDDGEAAAQIAAAGEVLDALAKTSALHTRNELRQAAWEFERASRSHTRAKFRHAQSAGQPATWCTAGPPSAGARTGPAPRWSWTRWSSSPLPPPTGTPSDSTPSRPRPPAEPQHTYDPPTSRQPPNLSPCCANVAAVSPRPCAATTPPPCAPPCLSSPRPYWPSPAGTPWPQPSPTPNAPATTPTPYSPRPPAAGNWTPLIPSATFSSGVCAAPRISRCAPQPRKPSGPTAPTITCLPGRQCRYNRHRGHDAGDHGTTNALRVHE
ncbi:relaxase/mobilization nuclease domain-containing protein [Streptomyces mirabilis]|uniref:relaxase/mobilization nuclease domain-containing protein n=1 Tax=Streptomyces mirabilis TaxID=68239 RepID=UPI00368C208D